MDRMRLRREYLWIPHLSRRDLYARVLDRREVSAIPVSRARRARDAGQWARTGNRNYTYDALNPYRSRMIRWTSWSGLFWSLYSSTMIPRYLSHGLVMASRYRRGLAIQQLGTAGLRTVRFRYHGVRLAMSGAADEQSN